MYNVSRTPVHPVETKLTALLQCEHRPLKPGEIPKRKGQTTIYEATGQLSPEFRALWTNPDVTKSVTAKHDGMCSKLVVVDDTIRVSRRLDVRKGNKPPAGAVPAAKLNSEGEVEFYWIDISLSTDYADFYYLSAIQKKGSQIQSVSVIEFQDDGVPVFVERSVKELESGTYELVGPKVQSNRYDIAQGNVMIQAVRKGKLQDMEVPKHFFIKHGILLCGAHVVEEALASTTPVHVFSEFILSRQIEGLVIHFSTGVLFKVNRGHIGHELDANSRLKFA